jgi:hypothetical protein
VLIVWSLTDKKTTTEAVAYSQVFRMCQLILTTLILQKYRVVMKYPIIAICCAICLCSCKSKKAVTDYHEKTIVNSELSAYHNVATIDTTRLLHIEDLKQVITIEEDVIVTEYDEKGNISKKTETKRKVVQDTNKVASKEEVKGESVVKNDSTHHIADISKKIDTETETVTKYNWLESFGKWLGIILGIAIVGYVIYLCIRKKLRVSKLFDVD